MVTFRLADSLPGAVYQAMTQVRDNAELRKRVQVALDSGLGSCALRDARVAGTVEAALFHFDGERYRLLAWVVMPNHVHVLFEPINNVRLGDIVGSWKSFTAKEANALTSRSGRFWAPDYFDRYIRDENHFHQASNYIEENPVKAGLVARREEWLFSSARIRR